MSNPVVFFDMEIGGQPAGRIEMTVRIYISFLFSFLCEVFPSSSLAKALMFVMFSLSDDDENSRSLFSNHHQPAAKVTIRFLFRSFWRALTTSGGPLLLS